MCPTKHRPIPALKCKSGDSLGKFGTKPGLIELRVETLLDEGSLLTSHRALSLSVTALSLSVSVCIAPKSDLAFSLCLANNG